VANPQTKETIETPQGTPPPAGCRPGYELGESKE